MAAARFVARSVIRRRPLTRLGLVLLIGIAGGALMATAAGARRTERAFPHGHGVAGVHLRGPRHPDRRPLGIAGGRLAWRVLTERLGIPAAPVIPLLACGALVITTLLVANLIGAWPMWAGRRTRPATALRAE